MSAAMFELLADPEKAVAISAGTNPGTKVHPEVVIAMQVCAERIIMPSLLY
jgi:hypothetical protein